MWNDMEQDISHFKKGQGQNRVPMPHLCKEKKMCMFLNT